MKEELINITKELSNIAKELSINSRILAILIALETNTPINLSSMLNKIPLNYLKDRDFSYAENKAEIGNSIKISFKDNDRNIYIYIYIYIYFLIIFILLKNLRQKLTKR